MKEKGNISCADGFSSLLITTSSRGFTATCGGWVRSSSKECWLIWTARYTRARGAGELGRGEVGGWREWRGEEAGSRMEAWQLRERREGGECEEMAGDWSEAGG